uniref:Uncharacterized protein n=1 Tax=viral metagenome TaxID=1070528 RepID=A0A6M3XLX3_9ZZZZ
MNEHTVTTNDIEYISVFLKEKDRTTGSITPYDLSIASSIVFRMRQYGETINTISVVMNTISSPANTLGFCRCLATFPAVGTYSSEIEVSEGVQRITWTGDIFIVIRELG